MESVDQDEEDKEVEMTVEEFQSRIREQVESNDLLRRRQKQLARMNTLVEKRERQAASTRDLYKDACQAMVECETSIKDLYCQLGMDYRDTDSETDEKACSDVIEIDEDEDDDDFAGARSDVIEIDDESNDDAMTVDYGEEEGELSWGHSLRSVLGVSLSHPVAAPEIATASEIDEGPDSTEDGEQRPAGSEGNPDEEPPSDEDCDEEESKAGSQHCDSPQTDLSCDVMDMDSPSLSCSPPEAAPAVNTAPTEVTVGASRGPATPSEAADPPSTEADPPSPAADPPSTAADPPSTAADPPSTAADPPSTAAKEPNDSDASNEEPNDSDASNEEPNDSDASNEEPNDSDASNEEPNDSEASNEEPNDSDASNEEPQPRRSGPARLASMQARRGVVVLRKLSPSAISSATAARAERGSEEEMSSDNGSDASWEPSDDEREPSPRASPKAKRQRGKDEPKKRQSSDKGPTSAKPQGVKKVKMEPKRMSIRLSKGSDSTSSPAASTVQPLNNSSSKTKPHNSSSSNTKPHNSSSSNTKPHNSSSSNTKPQANKGTSCVVPKAPNLATQPPTGRDVPLVPTGPNPATQPPTGLTEEGIKVGMVVLARRRISTWHSAKILEIKPTEKGHKYKVDMEEFGRSWLSGHHIAFLHTTMLDRLYVGVRLVAEYKEADQYWFYSGTLAELPNRKNQMRFLVFFDDGTPSYVRLPLIHLVCRPLQNGWEEDIEDKSFRSFLLHYLEVYPNLPMAMYSVGQQINAEYSGIQKRCRVDAIDGSLLLVVFLDDEHKEWIYRGSMRLQHMANLKKTVAERESIRANLSSGTFQAGSSTTASKVTSSNSNQTRPVPGTKAPGSKKS